MAFYLLSLQRLPNHGTHPLQRVLVHFRNRSGATVEKRPTVQATQKIIHCKLSAYSADPAHAQASVHVHADSAHANSDSVHAQQDSVHVHTSSAHPCLVHAHVHIV
jgi:hypothetical protein